MLAQVRASFEVPLCHTGEGASTERVKRCNLPPSPSGSCARVGAPRSRAGGVEDGVEGIVGVVDWEEVFASGTFACNQAVDKEH